MKQFAFAILPAHEGAFPTGWHDTLIKAAIHREDETAFANATSWLRNNSIDDALFREQRLLLAVIARFGNRLASDPAYPRLLGLQRMLWTRSRLALHEARPVLRELERSGIDMLLIKGAARLAEGDANARARAAHDIDIVVRPDQCRRALDALAAAGWAPNKGVTPQYLREHLASIRSINMLKGEFGDIDLHTHPFHPGQGGEKDDQAFWQRAVPARLLDVPVRIPGPEDRLALAIGLGGLEAHQHSDWLVDSAIIVMKGQVRWELFEDIVARRRMIVPATIAIRYLAHRLDHQVPEGIVERLTSSSRAEPLAYYLGFLQARPDYRASAFGTFMNAVAKHLRRRAESRQRPRRSRDRRLRARNLGKWKGAHLPPAVTEHRIEVPPSGWHGGQAHVQGVLFLKVPEARRRVEFEINGSDRHICRIRYRKLMKRKGSLLLGIQGDIDLLENETGLVLQARPSRQLRDSNHDRAKYSSLPFHVLSLDVRPADGAAEPA